ncbi:acyl-[acyl-carrier-protein] thioesterase [Wansuia hejianensis]|uniref:Acyl-ACP thioesterase n=1 Tax=Wansuia hejianensis TaxID=2763667 RepID=A0A926EVC7_9FIRM|nr:acyl-ACP thioesterase [Wansuia hejianensis]
MEKYTKEFIIPYYQCNKHGRVTATSILEYLGETSSEHSDYLGFGLKELRNESYGWMLNRWKVKFESYPLVKDKVIVETWTSRFYKFYANREFVVYNSNKEPIIKASTIWIFLDINKKRPIRIPIEMGKKYNIIEERLFEDFYDFNQDIMDDKSLEFRVRKTDIDYNNHVNNVRYLDWILERIPDGIEEDYVLNELEILYKKEVKYGDIIQSQINSINKSEDNMEFIHYICDDTSKDSRAFGRTLWKKSM